MKRLAFFLSAVALTASLALAVPQSAQAQSSARKIAVTTIPSIKVWVTVYKGSFADMRSVVANGWMSAGDPFYIHFGMAHSDSYYIRAQVHADPTVSSVIADTVAAFDNRTGAAIHLRKNDRGYYWQF